MTHRQSRGEDGFTLLEILVGLVISSLIMVGLTSVMQIVNTGWGRAAASIEKQSSLTAGLDILAGDIARIERIPAKDRKTFLFGGSPAEAVFILAERDSHNQWGLYWVRLLVRSDNGLTELVRMRARRKSGESDLSALSWRDEVVLLHGAYAVEMSYRAPRSGSEWSRYWEGQNRLPQQIRFAITGADGKPAVPEMVLALKIGAETACFEASAAGCTINSRGELTNQDQPQ